MLTYGLPTKRVPRSTASQCLLALRKTVYVPFGVVAGLSTACVGGVLLASGCDDIGASVMHGAMMVGPVAMGMGSSFEYCIVPDEEKRAQRLVSLTCQEEVNKTYLPEMKEWVKEQWFSEVYKVSVCDAYQRDINDFCRQYAYGTTDGQKNQCDSVFLVATDAFTYTFKTKALEDNVN